MLIRKTSIQVTLHYNLFIFSVVKQRPLFGKLEKTKELLFTVFWEKKYIAKNEHTLFYETIDSISFQQLKNVSVISWKCVFMCFLWKVFLCSLWWFNYIRIYDKASWVMNTVNWLSCHTITIFLLPGNVHLQSLFFHYFFSSSPNTSPKL